MRRTSMQLAAAVLAGGLAVTACGSSAARRRRDHRPEPDHLGRADQPGGQPERGLPGDKHKGVKPQRARGQDAAAGADLAAHLPGSSTSSRDQHGINVTTAQVQHQLAGLQAQAAQEKVSTDDLRVGRRRGAAGPGPADRALLRDPVGVREPAGRRQAADRAGRADGAADPGRRTRSAWPPRTSASTSTRSTASSTTRRSRWSRRRASWRPPRRSARRASASPSAKPRLTPPC